GFPVTDDVTRLPRPAREEDIVILMRSPSARILEFKRALEMRGIGVSADAGEDFFASMEVSVMFSLLEILDNPRQDVPLISVLRSPLFGFSADRLSVLRGARKTGDFYDALLSAGDEDTDSFISTLGALRQSAQTLSVRRLIARIFDECNVLGVFGAMDGGCERKENLLAFAALAERFESSGYCGLFSFVTHLRELRDGGELYSQRPPQNASGVRIMSIHKSKGLEFPIVILADLAKRFNNMDFTGSVLVHPKYGIGPQCVDTERRIRYPTVARQAIEHVLKRETKAEEMRLLYVAMTRAKEKLVMVHTQTGAPKRLGELMATASCPALPESVDGAKCLGDWVLLPLLCRPEAEPLRELTDSEAAQTITANDCKWEVFVHSCDEEENSDQTNDGETAGTFEEDDGIAPDTDTLLWNYPYPASTQLSAKITATQLKGRESDAEIAENAALPARLRSIARPRFMDGKKKLKAAERGTALHLVMEHISFDCASSADAVRAQINGLAERRLITQDQADAVDAELIASFLGSDIAERIRKGSNLNREYRFSILDSARKYDQRSAEDDEVLVQGVVDCFFEEQGQLVVLDFKTDRVTADTVAKRAEYYAPQLETYSSALERIMGKKVKERILYFFETGQCVNT
ncbi:MAG: PD-(D/E)XK nuclease family protein, partial [Oscillospiraceae bacterium]|nr:PD-(D/E)XK nuclease family protein [Oscillospiraceae bacterium]